MSAQHEEFPCLTPEARAAHDAALDAISSPNAMISLADFRRLLAAFLREAMRQAQSVGVGGSSWQELQAIADNLHSPPPPPPTLAQAREAARQLGGENAAIVHAFLATLGGGEA